jgi:hypothetical protein
MPSDPRLESALALAARIARLRAAEDWVTEKVEAGIADLGDEGECFMLTIILRFDDEGEQPSIGFVRNSGQGE